MTPFILRRLVATPLPSGDRVSPLAVGGATNGDGLRPSERDLHVEYLGGRAVELKLRFQPHVPSSDYFSDQAAEDYVRLANDSWSFPRFQDVPPYSLEYMRQILKRADALVLTYELRGSGSNPLVGFTAVQEVRIPGPADSGGAVKVFVIHTDFVHKDFQGQRVGIVQADYLIDSLRAYKRFRRKNYFWVAARMHNARTYGALLHDDRLLEVIPDVREEGGVVQSIHRWFMGELAGLVVPGVDYEPELSLTRFQLHDFPGIFPKDRQSMPIYLHEGSTPVPAVNEHFAEHLFGPDGQPLGHSVLVAAKIRV